MIDAASRGYWVEQYRRQEFAFDSQAVRPYFPYKQVEAGVLATASRLFKVEFRPAADAEVWHPSVSAWDVFDGAKQRGALLSRYASARGEGQVVQRGAAGAGHCGTADSRGRVDM